MASTYMNSPCETGADSEKLLSFVTGSTHEELQNTTLGRLLEEKAVENPKAQCLVFSEVNKRFTYSELNKRSLDVGKALIAHGVKKGDRVGILAGNCPPYVELIFACSHIGAALVVLNIAYTASEIKAAVTHAGCKLLLASPTIGKISNEPLIELLEKKWPWRDIPELQAVILLGSSKTSLFSDYEAFVEKGSGITWSSLQKYIEATSPDDVCNLQFTSGTTGSPKAAMLTHNNIINNGYFVGERMHLTSNDIICCPPPLFHCFGLVLGLLAAITHGSSVVFPSETFNARTTIDVVIREKCTVLHGVPTMFSAQLELVNPEMNFSSLRTGIAAGTSVPRKIMEDLREKLNLSGITITYGMTETSPASFMTFVNDPVEKRLATVGKILPHMKAKILNPQGEIVSRGTPGELFVAGFALQKGYWKSPEKTAEVMTTDKNGTTWMRTGDEATFDEEGYCRITGRIKDIIIRGGENIFPLEVEERLIQHPAIIEASVVGLSDPKYNEVVCAFLLHRCKQAKPSSSEIQGYVREKLAWHKAPTYIFWLPENEDFPRTGSGKIKKFVLQKRGEELVKELKIARSKL